VYERGIFQKNTASGHSLYPSDHLCGWHGDCLIRFHYAECEKAGSGRYAACGSQTPDDRSALSQASGNV